MIERTYIWLGRTLKRKNLAKEILGPYESKQHKPCEI